ASAEAAASHGDDIVLGARNVVRGGSHTGWIDATEMIGLGLCSVLASDYYYPAPLLAAFALARRGVLPFGQAWALVSQTPANAVELNDRGQIAPGQRADLIIVDPSAVGQQPRVVATIVAGRVGHPPGAERLIPAGGARGRPRERRKAPMDEPRYALYFVPPADSALYRFGAGFLGYDCYTGERLRHPQDIALTASEWEQFT